MKVRRERPSQRLHHRVTAPLKVDLPEGRFMTADWSLSGLKIADYKGSAEQGEILDLTLHVPFQGFDISFSATAKVVRNNQEDHFLAVMFEEIGERETEIMSHFVEEIIRGSITTVDDTLLRIDTPVTPVSTKPDPNPTSDVPVQRWPMKTIFFTTFYALAGLGVLAYVGLLAYSNFARLEVETAVVSAPLQPLIATSNGRIRKVHVSEKTSVSFAAPLITVEDPELERAIDFAQLRIDRATVALLSHQKELAAEKARLNDYQAIAQDELVRIESEIKTLQTQANIVGTQLGRFTGLLKKGWTTESKVDEIRQVYQDISGALTQARLKHAERSANLERASEGRFFNGMRLEGRMTELEAEIDRAWHEITSTTQEHNALLRQRDRLMLAAPSNGRVVTLTKPAGSTIKRGEEIGLFERDEARLIHAYLNQDEILEVGLGDEAQLYFPSLDEKIPARVKAVDRTEGYIDEMSDRYTWRGQKDRSARVTLAFEGLKIEDIRRRFDPGLPVIVLFERRNRNDIHHDIRHIVDPSEDAGENL